MAVRQSREEFFAFAILFHLFLPFTALSLLPTICFATKAAMIALPCPYLFTPETTESIFNLKREEEMTHKPLNYRFDKASSRFSSFTSFLSWPRLSFRYMSLARHPIKREQYWRQILSRLSDDARVPSILIHIPPPLRRSSLTYIFDSRSD